MKTPITILFVIVFFLEIKAQHYTHDIGGFVGSTSLQTDYGQRNHFGSELNNEGLSFSVAHYLSFYNRTLRWDPNNVMHNHLMIKTDLQYVSNTKLEHHGIYAKKQSFGGEQLRAMKGSVRMLNLGVNIEFYLKSLEEFVYPHSDVSFNPFFTFGVQYSFFNNTLTSDLGDWQQDISVLPKKYQSDGHIDVGSGESFVFNIGVGTRFKLTEKLDLVAQYNYQYFFSDKIDGLQAEVFENKNTEWGLNIQVGLIYHLNFSLPLFY
ncbi:THC0290_0291 family protein [Polaribacter aestuariivivens]|uniref:THC0290_0291 family protein n=1 Tax=Polaribacter aestuariivivens TaxID=2304626 RepID=UPI003F496234